MASQEKEERKDECNTRDRVRRDNSTENEIDPLCRIVSQSERGSQEWRELDQLRERKNQNKLTNYQNKPNWWEREEKQTVTRGEEEKRMGSERWKASDREGSMRTEAKYDGRSFVSYWSTILLIYYRCFISLCILFCFLFFRYRLFHRFPFVG